MNLILSPEAKKQIRLMYKSNPEKILVFGLKPNGCSGYEYVMNLETATSNIIIEDHGDIVVGIIKEFINNFNGTTLDYKKDKFESKFVFENPNVKQMCGCGESIGF